MRCMIQDNERKNKEINQRKTQVKDPRLLQIALLDHKVLMVQPIQDHSITLQVKLIPQIKIHKMVKLVKVVHILTGLLF